MEGVKGLNYCHHRRFQRDFKIFRYLHLYIEHCNEKTLSKLFLIIYGNLLYMVIFRWLNFYLINRHLPYKWVAVVSWLNYLTLAVDLWGSSDKHQAKRTVNPTLVSSVLLHIHQAAFHGFWKIIMTLTQTICPNNIALQVSKQRVCSALVGVRVPGFEKSATELKQKLFKCKSTLCIVTFNVKTLSQVASYQRL